MVGLYVLVSLDFHEESFDLSCVVLYGGLLEVDFMLVFLLCDGEDLAEGLLLELLDVAVLGLLFVELNVRVDLPESLTQGAIEVVLDVVVGSAWQLPCDLRPTVS